MSKGDVLKLKVGKFYQIDSSNGCDYGSVKYVGFTSDGHNVDFAGKSLAEPDQPLSISWKRIEDGDFFVELDVIKNLKEIVNNE